jgi:peroxiredoxin
MTASISLFNLFNNTNWLNALQGLNIMLFSVSRYQEEAMLKPNAPVPALVTPILFGEVFELGKRSPANFSLVVFYRGLHCPICSTHLRDLNTKIDELAKRGVETIAISSDTEERAAEAAKNWKLGNLKLGYQLTEMTARSWGLYMSKGKGQTSIGIEEPALFSEPGMFLIRPDGRLYWGSVSTMPFARPHFDEVLKALDFVLAKNYPARGDA